MHMDLHVCSADALPHAHIPKVPLDAIADFFAEHTNLDLS